MSCPIKVNRNTIELTVHPSCYCVLDLLCVTYLNSLGNPRLFCRFKVVASSRNGPKRITPLKICCQTFVKGSFGKFIYKKLESEKHLI